MHVQIWRLPKGANIGVEIQHRAAFDAEIDANGSRTSGGTNNQYHAVEEETNNSLSRVHVAFTSALIFIIHAAVGLQAARCAAH